MKKVLLTFIAGALSISFAGAQCTPDPALAGESFGLFPDSLATVYTFPGAGDQVRVVDLVTFADTSLPNPINPAGGDIVIYIDAFKIVDVRNVPAGMTYGTNIPTNDPSVNATTSPWGIWYNGGTVPNQTLTQGCVYINGTEGQWSALAATETYGAGSMQGAVQLEIDVDARIAASNPDISAIIANGAWLSSVPASFGGGVITVDSYWLVAKESGVGIAEVDESKFMLVNSYIDNATGITNIEFNAPYDMKGLEFNVYSVLGSKVQNVKFDVERGMNAVKFNGTRHAAGLYIYTISDGNSMLTSKMYTN
ncbi:MAG: hypothetical protein K9J17_13660 [Flavobacteriales bacterium]|nr:hypothetical protein [Flavobacteriales bacterium]